MSTTIIERLKKEIAGLESAAVSEKIGIVTEVADGIAEIAGLAEARKGRTLWFGAQPRRG
jgi:F0F1-type ATP synthase alpha subunit